MAGKKLEGAYFRVLSQGNEQLRGARLAQSMGLMQAAELVSMSPTTLSKWELGDQQFVAEATRKCIDQLADLLKITVSWKEVQAESWLHRRHKVKKKRAAPAAASDARVVPVAAQVPAPVAAFLQSSKPKHIASVLEMYKDGILTSEEALAALSRVVKP